MITSREQPPENLKASSSGLADPLHRQLAASLRKQFLTEYRAGQRVESQNELARRLKVSVPTVREALSALVEEGLIERRQGSGTYVSATPRKLAAAVLLELDFAHPRLSSFFPRLAQQARQYLRQRGYLARLYAGHQAPDELWQGELSCPEFHADLREGRLGGVLAVGLEGRGRWYAEVRARALPLVGMGAEYPHAVRMNLARATKMGVEYLRAQGRRRIAWLAWGRREEFVGALREAGLALREEWIRTELHPAATGSGWRGVREIWNALDEKPDALLIGDDVLFADARAALLELQVRIPEQLLVAAHANRGAAYPCSFPVAKIEVDTDFCAKALAYQLADRMEGRPAGGAEPAGLEVPIRLVAADSGETLEPLAPAAR